VQFDVFYFLVTGEEWDISSVAKLLSKLARFADLKLEQATDLRGYTVGVYTQEPRGDQMLATISWHRRAAHFLLFRPVGRDPFYVDITLPNYMGVLEVHFKLLKEVL
jgi:hypothetical protein